MDEDKTDEARDAKSSEGNRDAGNAGKPKKRFSKQGCLGCLFVVLLFFGYVLWIFGEQGRNFNAVRDALTEGMTHAEVLAILTGRYVCNYRADINGETETFSCEELLEGLESETSRIPLDGNLNIGFLGATPAHPGLHIKFDSEGRVVEITTSFLD